MNKLHDKVAIITGGASGIGEATALLFAEHGARAVVIADVQDEKGQKLAETIGTLRSTYIHCDVTDENQVKSLVESTVKLYGHLDVMFCNAGIASPCTQTVLDFDIAAYAKIFAVNVGGVAASLKQAAQAMVEGGVKGSIICTASIAARTGGDRCTDFVTKCAVLGLAESASMQLAEHGIRVNCVSQGPVATPLLSNKVGKGIVEAEKTFKSSYWLKGLMKVMHGIRVNCVSPGPVATPLLSNMLGKGIVKAEKTFESSYWLKGLMKVKHVADAVLFLACEDSEFITGHNLAVNGGFKSY